MPVSAATLHLADPFRLTRALADEAAPAGCQVAAGGRVSWAGAGAYWSARPSASGVQLVAGASEASVLSEIQQSLGKTIALLAPHAGSPLWSEAIAGGDVEIVPPAVDDYLIAHSPEPDAVLGDLYAATLTAAGSASMMQVSHDEGSLLTLLTKLAHAISAVEVGTFTGYSTICIARGLQAGGQLITCDVSAKWAEIGARHWAEAGLAGVIEARIGPAIDTLRRLPPDPALDFAFIDADKQGYRSYYEELVPRMRPGGLIVMDNVFLGGRVLDPACQEPHHVAMRELNDFVRSDPRVEAVMIPVRDGMTIARRTSHPAGEDPGIG